MDKCKLGVISQERLKLSANMKSYAASVGTTTNYLGFSDLEWPFYASRAISAVAELLVVSVLRFTVA